MADYKSNKKIFEMKRRNIDTATLKNEIEEDFKTIEKSLLHKREFISNMLKEVENFCKEYDVFEGVVIPGEDYEEYLSCDVFDVVDMEQSGISLFGMYCENKDIYQFMFKVSEDEEDDEDTINVEMCVLRKKDGFLETMNFTTNKWVIARDTDSFSKEIQEEIENKTQKGRMFLDIYDSIAAEGMELEDTSEVETMTNENTALVPLLEENANCLEALVSDMGEVLLVPDGIELKYGFGIGYDSDSNEYVLYQYINEDGYLELYGGAYMSSTEELELYEYINEVDKTKDIDVVKRFIDSLNSEINADNDDPEMLVIPASWNRTVSIVLEEGALDKLKYELVNGGMTKPEKDAIRTFKKSFGTILEQYDEEEVDYPF